MLATAVLLAQPACGRGGYELNPNIVAINDSDTDQSETTDDGDSVLTLGVPTAAVDGPFFVMAGAVLQLSTDILIANDSAAPTATSTTLTVTAVTSGVHGDVALTGTSLTYTPATGFDGADTFTYTITDATGAQATGNVLVRVTTPFTWTGNAGDQLWSSPDNWCGAIAADQRGCLAGAPPSSSDVAVFDGACAASCTATIDNTTAIAGIRIAADFDGVLQQNALTLTLGSSGFTQEAGAFVGSSDQSSSVSTSTLTLSGGRFVAPAGNLTIGGDFTVSGSLAFDANNGTVTFSGGGTLTPGSIVLASLYLETGGCQTHTLVGTLSVAGNVTANAQGGSCNGSWLTGGVIDIKGNLTMLSGWALWGSVDTVFQLSGVNHVVTSSVPAQTPNIPSLRVAASGTVSLVGDVQIQRDLIWVSGTIDAGTSSVQFNGGGITDLGAQRLNSVAFTGNGYASGRTVVGTLYVDGPFTLSPYDSAHESGISGGTIDVKGAVASYNAYAGASGSPFVLSMSGSGTQSLYQMAGQAFVCAGVVINAPAGGVALASDVDLSLQGQTLAVTAGSVDMQGHALTIDAGLSLNGTVVTKNGGVLTVSGVIVGAGSLYGGTINP